MNKIVGLKSLAISTATNCSMVKHHKIQEEYKKNKINSVMFNI